METDKLYAKLEYNASYPVKYLLYTNTKVNKLQSKNIHTQIVNWEEK